MSDLKIVLSMPTKRVQAGGSIPVRLDLSNPSTRLLSIVKPAGIAPPPLVFELRPDATAAPTYELSRAARQEWLLGDDTLPPRPPSTVVLKAGEVVAVDEDLAALALGPIVPGTYQVVARWEQEGLECVSNAVELEVVVPDILRSVSLACPLSGEGIVFMSQAVPGATLLSERNSTIARAEGTIASERHRLPAPAQAHDLAIAAHLDQAIDGRWHAWLQGQELWAACSWGGAVVAKPPPAKLTLLQPRFARPAFHLPKQIGLVSAIVGVDAQGTAVAQQFTATAKKLKLAPSVSLGTAAPRHLAARGLSLTGRQLLLWSISNGAGTEIWGCVLDERGKLQDGPRVLFRAALPLLAWHVPPVGQLLHTEISLLLGPTPDNTLEVMKVPWGGQPSITRMAAPQEPVSSWLLDATTSGEPIVVGTTDHNVLYRRGDSATWQHIGGSRTGATPPTPEHVHVLSSQDVVRVGWFDRAEGFVYVDPADFA